MFYFKSAKERIRKVVAIRELMFLSKVQVQILEKWPRIYAEREPDGLSKLLWNRIWFTLLYIFLKICQRASKNKPISLSQMLRSRKARATEWNFKALQYNMFWWSPSTLKIRTIWKPLIELSRNIFVFPLTFNSFERGLWFEIHLLMKVQRWKKLLRISRKYVEKRI